MLEVLISLVLIALALLGLAGLQSSALKLNKGATLRMQAVLLSDEIAERIENNKAAAIAGNYVVAASSTPATASSNCLASSCTAAALAEYDLAMWQTRIAENLPGATWQISQTAGSPTTYQIVLTWQDRRDNADKIKYATSGTTETFALTSSKVIYQ